MPTIEDALDAMADPAYRTFQAALIPNVDPDRVIGVRIPTLRRWGSKKSPSPAKSRSIRPLRTISSAGR